MTRLILLLAAGAASLSAKTAKLDGRDVIYETQGKGSKAVLLVHGWTCDHTFWQAQTPALAAEYKVLALDLPGHGRSASADAYPMTLFARAAEAVLRAERIDKATLVGHSMGGAVILEFSRLFPAKLEGAVFVDSMLLEPGAAEKLPPFAERFRGEQGVPMRRKMVESMFSAASTPEVRARILSVMLSAPESLAVGAMQGMFSHEVWKESKSGAPALAVVANPEQIRESALRARFPNLTFKHMPGTGHFLMMEKPAEFNAILLEWLKGR